MKKTARCLLSMLLVVSLIASLFTGVFAEVPETGSEEATLTDVTTEATTPTNETPENEDEPQAQDVEQTEPVGTATLVTDVATLTAGDSIIISALDYDFALSTTQNTNNRAQAAITKTDAGIQYGADAQVITLVKGSAEGTFAFQVEEGKYLSAASSSGNYLKTTDSITEDASWSISLDEETSAASITAAGAFTRNVLRYNASSGLFSCYAAGNTQKLVAIYKVVKEAVRTVYFDNTASKWGSVNIYAWNGETCYTEAWPGTAMTSYGTHIYSFEVSADAEHVIFNDGTNQTKDLILPTDGKDIYLSETESWSTFVKDYYLFGYINGADYACEGDYTNMGTYKFVDGKLTAFFTQESYIGVKATGNVAWYMTKEYVSDTQAVFHNTKTGASEKMRVPAGAELTFTLVVGDDDTVTLSYEAGDCNHNYVSSIVKATCTSRGYTAYTCSYCEDTYRLSYSNATGHSYTAKVTKAATCTTTGTVTYTCSRCSDSYTETVSPTGHNYNAKQTVAHTCEHYATYLFTCATCGNSYTTTGDQIGKQWLLKVPTGAPAADFASGTIYRYRNFTPASSKWTEKQKDTVYYVNSWPTGFDTTSHLYAQYSNKNGKAVAYENLNDKLVINSDEIVGYLYYHWCYEGHPYTNATETDTFNRFHAYYSTVSPSEADWNDVSDDSYRFDDSTACDDSCWYFYVPVYGQSYTISALEATGRAWSNWSDWSATAVTATPNREVQTATGYRYSITSLADHKYVNGICSVCQEKDPDFFYYLFGFIDGKNYACEEDSANMGTYKFVDGKLITSFKQDSYIGVKTTNNASWYMPKTYSTGKKVVLYNGNTGAAEKMLVPAHVVLTFTLVANANGTLTLSYEEGECLHNYTSAVTSAATCTQVGVQTYTCTRCKDTYTKAIPATGHKYTSKVANPTCTARGYTTTTCSTCGHSYRSNYVNAIGHNYTDKVTTAATCTTAGVRTYTCSKCGGNYKEAIPATGHNHNVAMIKAATCKDYATFSLTCASCGNYQTMAANVLAQKWLTKVPTGVAANLFETKTVYRYRDLTAGAVNWLKHQTDTVYYVNSWPSGFSNTHQLYAQYNNKAGKVTAYANTNTKLEIASDEIVGYLYYHWCYEDHPYTNATETETFNRFHAYYSTVSPSEADWNDVSDNSYRFDDSTACGDSCWYFYVPVYAQNYTIYTSQIALGTWSAWSDWSTTKATASTTRDVETANGYRYTAATLGDHQYKSVTTAPTCTTAGYTKHTCTACGNSYTSDNTAATGHSYKSVVTAPTCSAAGYTTYTCTKCSYSYIGNSTPATDHSYKSVVTAPTCTTGGYTTHTCTTCKYSYISNSTAATGHSYKSVVTAPTCSAAGYTTHTCSVCNHSYTSDSKPAIDHTYKSVVTAPTCTEKGYTTCTCSVCGDSYTCDETEAKGHSYTDGTCSVCGFVLEYYLFGYINGANYACEEDWENMGTYKFVDGKLTATFTADSYVAVKITNNEAWYMTNGWLGTDVNAADLFNTSTLGENANKLFVPGNVEVTFTLTDNGDGSLTLSYTTPTVKPSVVPTLGLKYPTVSFEDVIIMNVYYSAENIQDVVDMGLITFAEKPDAADIALAETKIPGYTPDGALCISSTEGIAPKDLGDDINFAVYAELADGTYAYSKVASYSPKTYAMNQLKTGAANMRPLVAAMLNYGAAAQTYFKYNPDNLVNGTMTEDQKALVEAYSDSMITAVTQPSGSKVSKFVNDKTYLKRYPTISFEGAFCINYYYQPSLEVKGDVTMYVWNAEDYNKAGILTKENATESVKMTLTESGEYLGVVGGIAAKDLDKVVYVAFIYNDGTTEHCGGVVAYSIGAYCKSQAATTGALSDLAKACAVYGYYAKQLFG